MTGGAYSPHYLKGPSEDQVFGYDTLILVDVSVFLIYFYGVCGTSNYGSLFKLLGDH